MWLCFKQETVLEEKNEAIETMSRVDEGVEEFFTKKIIPDYAPWVDLQNTCTHTTIKYSQNINFAVKVR